MRARRRRSVLNTVSAAVLEVAIMGLFVIIAQPQLREALFEILQADKPLPAAQANFNANNVNGRSKAPTSPADTLDRTLQAVASSPVTQAIESSFSQWANGTRPEMGGLRDQPAQRQVSSYSPYDQYESFSVNVPTSNQSAFQQPVANDYGHAANQRYAVPQYVPPQGHAPQNYSAQNYSAQNFSIQNYGPQNFAQSNGQYYAPTQLTANQWNIASAAQLPRPSVNGNTQNWIPSQVTETSFRQVYPPPYGTQSMWK